MCEKVEDLYNEFNTLKKKKEALSKLQYYNSIKALYKKWLYLLMEKDVCTTELNKLGENLQFEICLN